MSIAPTIEQLREEFPGLDAECVLVDGPGGTQVPVSVINAMTDYFQHSNANLHGAFGTSIRSTLVVERARIAAGRFLACDPATVGFGANMTSLNFALASTAARDFSPGDEIVLTKLDHDANIAPWLEIARDRDLTIRFADISAGDCGLDYDCLRQALSARTRIVACTWASNAVGTIVDIQSVAALAHEVGALAWVDAVHYASHRPIDVTEAEIDVLICSPYKFYGPHLGLFYGRREVLEGWRPFKVRPAPAEPIGHRFETGTGLHENLAGFTAAVEYIERVGWSAIMEQERRLGERFLAGLSRRVQLLGRMSMEGRTSTFAVILDTMPAAEAAVKLAEKGIAAWAGNFYAPEIFRRLNLSDGALRIGFMHYNTVAEVDRVLDELEMLA